ncbi:MAG: PAS domain S-box protein [Holophagales bacterium]|nr:PAS domain S-box protein [Holophagales bacterium]MBK9968375.1 PAS domain S-box protein [Holophagales bacterium]
MDDDRAAGKRDALAVRVHASLVRALPDFVWVKDADGVYLACNETFERFFGAGSRGRIDGKTDFDLFPAKNAATSQVNDQLALAGDGPIVVEEEIFFPGIAEPRVFESVKGPLRDGDGVLLGVFGSAREVTEARAAEDRLALQDQVLGMIAAGEPLAATLEALARAVEAQCPGSTAAILILDPDGVRLRLAAAPSAPDALLSALAELTVREGSGATGTAAFRREQVLVEDVATDQFWTAHHETARQSGIRSGLATPILSRDQTLLGTLTVYWQATGAPSQRQRRLSSLATRIAAIAISRSREEEALRESQERYRLVSENGTDVIWLFDFARNRFTWISPSVEGLLGFTAEEALQRSIAESLSPEALRFVENELAARLARLAAHDETARRQMAELDQTRKDGTTVPTEVMTTLIADAGGRVTHMQGVSRDISERRRAETAREEEAAFRDALIEASADGIAVISQQHQVIHANRRFAEMLGYDRGEVTGLHTWDWEASLTEAEIRAQFAELESIRKTFETRHRRKDGSLFDVEVSASGLRYGGEGVVLTISRDITDRKRAEAARETLKDQLMQAQKMESVGRLAGGVAHDFNNMLSVIQGHAALALEQTAPGSPVRESLIEIERAAQRSARLTQQLLTFARKQSADPRRIDLNAAVGRVRGMLDRLLGEEVELVFRPAENLWPVRVDPAQVEQLLANLCVNSRDAISGTGRITLETANVTLDEAWCATRPGSRPGPFVRLAVDDDGCGMSATVRAHLFEPFFTTKEVGRGTGLGLATAYGIVQQAGGFIDVESAEGEGSSFRIHFPRCEEPGPAAVASPPAEAPRGGGETILVVEDEPALLRLVATMLEELGYRVLAAGSPQAALELAGRHARELRLLLTDVVMPGMNGRDLAARVTGLLPGLPCLFMSGYTADVIAHRGLLGAGVQLLSKPFSPLGLAVHVHGALHLPAGAASGPGQPPGAAADAVPSGGRRVLYVDDETALVVLMKRVLSRLGHEVTALSDPSAALEAFLAAPLSYDAVVSDLSMPGMPGLELARRVLEARPGIAVILTSGYVSEEDEGSALAAGARALVPKPLTVEELGRALDSLLRQG